MKVILLEVLLLVVICSSTYGVEKNVETYQEEIAPGVIKLTKGKVDTYTPYTVLGGKPASEVPGICRAGLDEFLESRGSLCIHADVG